jgi:hypothetical protein
MDTGLCGLPLALLPCSSPGPSNRFLSWVAQTDQDIDAAINESALGTGYEDALKKEIYNRLGIHPLTGAHVLPTVINL